MSDDVECNGSEATDQEEDLDDWKKYEQLRQYLSTKYNTLLNSIRQNTEKMAALTSMDHESFKSRYEIYANILQHDKRSSDDAVEALQSLTILDNQLEWWIEHVQSKMQSLRK